MGFKTLDAEKLRTDRFFRGLWKTSKASPEAKKNGGSQISNTLRAVERCCRHEAARSWMTDIGS
jgi:hypothetical protein